MVLVRKQASTLCILDKPGTLPAKQLPLCILHPLAKKELQTAELTLNINEFRQYCITSMQKGTLHNNQEDELNTNTKPHSPSTKCCY